MVHLMAARKVRPGASELFYLGNLAPDAVKGWATKDIAHLRSDENGFRSPDDRLACLAKLAEHTESDFAEGVLLHLFVDYVWDTTILPDYIMKTGEDWFAPYREELSKLSAYAFHTIDWADELWTAMCAVPKEDYGRVNYATDDDLYDFVTRNDRWSRETHLPPSEAFPPELVERFCDEAAEKYAGWRANS
jgi:hypothetical protein